MTSEQQFKATPHQEFMKDQYFRKWYPKWINNAMENYPLMKKEFETKDRCVSCLPRPMNRPCMIIGSGKSLNKAGPILKDWKNPIFAAASNAITMAYYEKEPEYICAFDSLWSLDKQLAGYKWENSALLTHPNAEPNLIKNWRWDKYYYRRVFPGHEFFEFTFPLMFPWIKIGLRFSGTVVNNAITLALFLGFNPIILVGVDLGFRDLEDSRGIDYEYIKKEFVRKPKVKVERERKIIQLENGAYAHPFYIGFKNALLDIYMSSQKNVDFIDCSDGIISELTKADIKDVVKTQGFGDYGVDKNQVIKNIVNWQKTVKELMKDELQEKNTDI